jgi:type III pantothenate kinase
MLLAIDAGNTNTVFAVFEGAHLLGQWRMATEPKRTADEYGVWLLQLLARAGLNAESIQAAILSSVVPQADFALRMLARHYFNVALLRVGDPQIRLGIEVALERASEIGADRLTGAVAAWERYRSALIVIDFGTATTFDLIDAMGRYQGGVIAPGIHLSLAALHRAAAKLPNVAVERPSCVIGKNTIEAMQSGIYFGYVGLIEGIVTRIRQEQEGVALKVIATGGLAPLFARATPSIDALEADLMIEGLRLIHERNAA